MSFYLFHYRSRLDALDFEKMAQSGSSFSMFYSKSDSFFPMRAIYLQIRQGIGFQCGWLSPCGRPDLET